MTEYAEGGIVEGGTPVVIERGCHYAIPAEFAQRWVDQLKRINEGLDKPTEDGVE